MTIFSALRKKEQAAKMDRSKYVLAVMAAGGDAPRFSPAQLQKLFFLMDAEAAGHTGGPYFHFTAYDYGPFDSAVYDEVEQLTAQGLAVVDKSGFFRVYTTTPAGRTQGEAALLEFTAPAREYAAQVSQWVRSVSFNTLVSEIYKKYPLMKANSIFKE